jgi:hypothetical protein
MNSSWHSYLKGHAGGACGVNGVVLWVYGGVSASHTCRRDLKCQPLSKFARLSRLFDTLGVWSRAQAIVFAWERGFMW